MSLVTAALDRLGAFEATLHLRRAVRMPWLTVVSYHRLGDPRATEHDRGVIDATPREFDAQMAFMARYFTVIDVATLCEALAGGKMPPNAALITFDDGYRTCLDVALPILRRHGLRAAFFIPTAYFSERRLLWWDRVARAVHHTRGPELRLAWPEPLLLLLPDAAAREKGIRAVLRLIKRHRGLDVDAFVTELEARAGVPLSRDEERRAADRLLMRWDEVRGLADLGMDIGSHTRTHRVLQTVPVDQLDDELRGSRRDLEAELGRPVHALAYPVGHRVLQHPAIVAAVARAGYSVAFSNATGINLGRRPHRFDIRRLATDVGMPLSTFRRHLALPSRRELLGATA